MGLLKYMGVETQSTPGVWTSDDAKLKEILMEQSNHELMRYAQPTTALRFACQQCHAEIVEEWNGDTPHTFSCAVCQQSYTADWVAKESGMAG